jgi:hypothetical protein
MTHRLEELSSELKTTKAALAEIETLYEASSRRLQMTEDDLEKAEDNQDAAEAKAKACEDELKRTTEEMRSQLLLSPTLAPPPLQIIHLRRMGCYLPISPFIQAVCLAVLLATFGELCCEVAGRSCKSAKQHGCPLQHCRL